MKCPKCGEVIPIILNSFPVPWLYNYFEPTGCPSMSTDFYTHVKEIVDKFRICMFDCNSDYGWLQNVKEGSARLREEGYICISSACDDMWKKKDDPAPTGFLS
jgi:hypothetical protein